ncbi:hypothetical protein AAHE18_03G334700 [Arachis hypogaea]|nr:uncharacterized protein DS421_3g102420 [Arachis hypogaea]
MKEKVFNPKKMGIIGCSVGGYMDDTKFNKPIPWSSVPAPLRIEADHPPVAPKKKKKTMNASVAAVEERRRRRLQLCRYFSEAAVVKLEVKEEVVAKLVRKS